jgi:ADP-heptose:LPS heptosyltransferase
MLQWVHMKAHGHSTTRPQYSEFVFLSAGPVGDHALVVDYANRFFESAGIPSKILMKHPNPFLRDMAIPYYDHISYIGFVGWKGKVETFLYALSSIWRERCYVLVLPIPPPRYLKLFAYFIRFFTRSRIVALDSLCGFSIPGGPFSSASFVGKGNYIPAHVDTELYYEQANRLLMFLGYSPVPREPKLAYVDTPDILAKYSVKTNEYIVMHICASQPDRSLPADRWHRITKELIEQLPSVSFLFTGTSKDSDFMQESIEGLPSDRVQIASGLSMQELLTLHAHAKTNATVHTGNAHLINMLHVPTVTINFKGIHMFRFSYNEKGIELYSKEGCTCHPLERKCSMVEYKGKEYMACLFNTPDSEIIQAVATQFHQ